MADFNPLREFFHQDELVPIVNSVSAIFGVHGGRRITHSKLSVRGGAVQGNHLSPTFDCDHQQCLCCLLESNQEEIILSAHEMISIIHRLRRHILKFTLPFGDKYNT